MFDLKKLACGPAFFVWAACVFAAPVWAQDATTVPAAASSTPAAPAPSYVFSIDIQAPPDIATYLDKHIELQRYRELTDLDAGELNRLLAASQRNVQELLGTLGYFSAEVSLALRAASAGSASQVVQIVVVPGEPVRIGTVAIDFRGAIADDAASNAEAKAQAQAQREAIRAAWPLKPGMAFTQAAWDNAKSQALRLLTERRYPVGTVADSQASIDPDTHTADLRLQLDSGALYRLGPLSITGVERYDPTTVARLARLDPGTEFDQTQLNAAQQRLSDSGYFDSAFVRLDTSGDPGAAPVIVQLREAKMQKVVLGIGASTDSGARLSLEHTHHRVPGIGWRAVSKLSADNNTQSIETELTAPPDDANWRWVTSALVQQQTSGSYRVDSQRYRVGRTQNGERIDRNYYLQYDLARTVDSTASTQPGDADAITANYAWTQRNFDSLPFPSRGYGLGVEVGGGTTLGSSQNPFFRTQLRWLGVVPLGSTGLSSARASRLAMRMEAGAVLAKPDVSLPSTQLFLTGGDTTVRGYAYRSIGTTLADGSTAAGRYMASGSVEWQRPIVAGGKLTDWETSLFVDAGAVADKPSELKAQVGVGAGVRWKSPVGPLQMDLAYGVTVKKFRLHMSVGFTF